MEKGKEPKRRLPIIGSPVAPPPADAAASGDARGDESGDEPRPPWQWTFFGTAAIFGAWLPLAYGAEYAKTRAFRRFVGETGSIEETQDALARLTPAARASLTALTVALYVAPLLLGAFAGGYLVGRWGQRAGVREAALAGVATACVVSALTCASSGPSLAPLVSFLFATPAAALGGLAGLRRRRRVG